MVREFQASGLSWEERSEKDELAAGIDPIGSRKKNLYIHTIHCQALGRALRSVQGTSALDFGCGTGRICKLLETKGWRVVGVDITHGMLVKAKALAYSSKVSFSLIDGRRLPFRDSGFDLVVTVYVLQFILPHVDLFDSVATEVFRVLKPMGTLVILGATNTQQLTVDRHKERLTRVGFTPLRDEPVRLSYDRYLAFAERRVVPESFVPALAWLGTRECRQRQLEGNMTPDYWDHLYVFRKPR